MPIYEFKCRGCDQEFEKLVFNKDDVFCPHCDSRDLIRLMSACSFKSEGGVVSSAGGGCSGCSASSCASCH